MAITYTWKLKTIKKISKNGTDNIIFQTYWDCTGTDSETGATGIFQGATPFDPAKVNSNTFIAYEDLTEEIVLSWIKSYVLSIGTYQKHIQDQIKEIIDRTNNPPHEVTEGQFPWDPPQDPIDPMSLVDHP
jgi:hypothetical protein